MGLDPALRELFSDYVVLKPRSSIDQYGKPSFSSGASIPARLVAEYEVIATADARDSVQTGVAYLYGTPTVDITYSMTLSDGSSVIILAVDEDWDESGPHHTVVRFGRGG